MAEFTQELAGAAYKKHLPEAQALAADQVMPFRVDIDLAINNIDIAMQVVEDHRAEIPDHLPRIPLALLDSIPPLALATKLAALQAAAAAPELSPTDMIAAGWQYRAMLLPVMGGLAAMSLIPQKLYKQILKGQGTRDMAEDVVALVKAFRDYEAAILGKHAVPEEILAKAESTGSWLLQKLRKKGAPRPSVVPPEVDIRDRMATLLTQRYTLLRVVGFYFYPEDVDDYVPLLMSRHVVRRKKDSDADEPAEK